MAGVERVDIKLFDETLQKLKNTIKVFDSATAKMNTQTDTLLYSWEGKGKDAFQNAYKQLKTSIKDETENLVAIKDDLQAIKDSYDEWDKESGKTMSGNSVK